MMSQLADQIKNLSPEQRALLERRLAAREAAAPTGPTLRPRLPSDPRVLSCAQHQLWFIDQLAPGRGAYNVPYAVALRGDLDLAALKRALDGIVARHEILRTMYVPYQGKVIPAVAKQWSVSLEEVDLRPCPDQLQSRMEEDASRPFDLARDLKLRTWLYRLPDDRAVLLHLSHHIAWDLQSRIVFYRELEQLYGAFAAGQPSPLPELPIQYADYALWQRRSLQGETLARLESYWKQKLTGAPPFLELPTDFPRPAFQNLAGGRLPVRLDAATLDTARSLARDNRVTLYMTLLSSFYVFLSCWSGQDDLSVGSPFDERRDPQLEPLIGMFINTLVLRTRLDGSPTFLELLQRVRETVLGAIAHQELPFEKIVDAVQPPRDLGRMPLFQANFRLQGGAAPALRLPGIEIASCKVVDNATAKFDLALELPSLPGSSGYIEYSATLFRPETAQRMADDYQTLLHALLAQPGTPIDQLETVRAVAAHARRT